MAELGNFLNDNDSKHESEINVEMLDYDYIRNCTDVNNLKAIHRILESGKEGFYPHLLETVEKKILDVLPDKEKVKILRMKKEVTPVEISTAESELEKWQKSIMEADERLKLSKSSIDRGEQSIFENSNSAARSIPPPRGSAPKSLANSTNKYIDTKSLSSDNSTSTDRKEEKKRISGYDFRAWEKFDVDAAIAEQDHEETQKIQEVESLRKEVNQNHNQIQKKRQERFQREIENLRQSMDINNLTAVQREYKAAREKQKGNDCYRIGENDEAYACYSRSIAYDDTNAVLFANRALVSLRLEHFESAIDDCNRALALDNNYNKARTRRGLARLRSGKYAQAIEDFQESLQHEPQKGELLALLDKAKSKFYDVEGYHYGTKVKTEGKIMDPFFGAKINNNNNIQISQQQKQQANELQSTASLQTERKECEIFINKVKSIDRLLLPGTSAYTLISNGCYFYANEVPNHLDQVDNKASSNNQIATGEVSSGGFTRIIIQDEDDDDDDEEEEEEEEEEGEEEEEHDEKSASDIIPTRISIVVKDEEEEEEEGKVNEVPVTFSEYTATHRIIIEEEDDEDETEEDEETVVPGFTRINIEDNDEEEEEEENTEEPLVHSTSQSQPDKDQIRNDTNDNEESLQSTHSPQTIAQPTPNPDPVVTAKANKLKDLGNTLMQKERYDDAVNSYTKCLELDSSNWATHCNRALAFIKLKRFIEAQVDCLEVIKNVDNHHQVGLLQKALFRRAQAIRGESNELKFETAISDLNTLLIHDPQNILAKSLLEEFHLLMKSNSSHSSSGGHENNYPKMESETALAGGVIGVERNEEATTQASEQSTNSWEVFNLKKQAMSKMEQGLSSQALVDLYRAVALATSCISSHSMGAKQLPDDIIPLMQLIVSCELSLGNSVKALEACNYILNVDPLNLRALTKRAEINVQLGNIESAKEDALTVLRCDPSNNDMMQLLDQLQPPIPPPPEPISLPAVAVDVQPPSLPEEITTSISEKKPVSIDLNVASSSSTLPPEDSNTLKNLGNEALKKQDFQMALDLYTKALVKDPQNTAALSNRALVLLKLKRFVEAEKDATTLLNSNMDLEASLKAKALYRRALARKSMNDEHQLTAALADLDFLLALEPENKEAQREQKAVETLLYGKKASEKGSKTNGKMETISSSQSNQKSLPSTGINEKFVSTNQSLNNNLGLVERSTVKKKTVSNESIPNNGTVAPTTDTTIVQSSLPTTTPLTGNKTTTVMATSSSSKQVDTDSTTSSTAAATADSQQQLGNKSSKSKKSTLTAASNLNSMISTTISVPTEPPKTVYELERIWRSVRSRNDLFATYLKTFKKTTFQKVFKETVSPDLLSSVIATIKDHIVVPEPEVALFILEGLATISKFSMMVSLLPDLDINGLKTIVEKMSEFSTKNNGTGKKVIDIYKKLI